MHNFGAIVGTPVDYRFLSNEVEINDIFSFKIFCLLMNRLLRVVSVQFLTTFLHSVQLLMLLQSENENLQRQNEILQKYKLLSAEISLPALRPPCFLQRARRHTHVKTCFAETEKWCFCRGFLLQ